MSKANGKCNRCNGRGMRDTPVVHMGVPGLCYGCNGAGTYKAFAAVQEAARKAKAINDAFSVAYTMTNDVAERNGGFIHHDRDLRKVVRSMTSPFSSADYARVRGIEVKAAFIELCRIGRARVCPVVGDDLKIIGWTNE